MSTNARKENEDRSDSGGKNLKNSGNCDLGRGSRSASLSILWTDVWYNVEGQLPISDAPHICLESVPFSKSPGPARRTLQFQPVHSHIRNI